ncbi:MAG TPA: MFS transporter [Pseudorhodoferax sp.]|jgi:FSR family fosmidomycin resistance protein-like MFS transporter|nr:MFS transporter [Pseudorhodoferax sp.]
MNRARLGLLSGTHAVNDLYQGLVPALLPFMVAERGYSYAAASGLVLAATGLSSVVQPLFGWYADRAPRPWLVPLGFVVAALGLVLAGLAQGYLLTWCAAALCGLGIAAYHPPATVAARQAGGGSQKAMSVFSVGGASGAACAPLLAAAVVGDGALHRSWLLGLPALAMLVVWLVATRHDAAPGAQARRGVAQGAANDWRAFGLMTAVVVGWSIPYVTVLSMLSLLATRELGATPVVAAGLLTAYTAAGAAGTLLGGWLGDRVGRMAAIRAGYALALPALAGLVLAPSAAWAGPCALVLGVAMFLPFAPQVTLAQDYLPRNPAMASGITLGLALSVGGMVAPLLGLLSDAHGLRATLLAALCVLCCATLMAWRLRDRRIVQAVAAAVPARA